MVAASLQPNPVPKCLKTSLKHVQIRRFLYTFFRFHLEPP
ncbi:hypothetical protein DZF84_13705 [Vibrio parahaemolyticus]|nr:hypothetical protein [Escherichia coli]EGQ8026065.1 hypothetical protein [Vibrio vulnificus]EGQ9862998.1 hypothetical protein [Vibrio parahaemolyticus]EGR0142642.1 hypothetical protein [Vibrio cholerae]RZV21998.1 hypothetical protein EOJ41_05030 [Vibrio alginolyticus]